MGYGWHSCLERQAVPSYNLTLPIIHSNLLYCIVAFYFDEAVMDDIPVLNGERHFASSFGHNLRANQLERIEHPVASSRLSKADLSRYISVKYHVLANDT